MFFSSRSLPLVLSLLLLLLVVILAIYLPLVLFPILALLPIIFLIRLLALIHLHLFQLLPLPHSESSFNTSFEDTCSPGPSFSSFSASVYTSSSFRSSPFFFTNIST